MMTIEQPATRAVELESPPCELCGADAPVPVAARPDLIFGGETIYTMCRCSRCGVLYQHPRPTAASMWRHYPDDEAYQPYRPTVASEPALRRWARRRSLAKRCRLVLRHVAAGRLLDVGCATGDFISEMARYPGWGVVGVEPIATAARRAAASAGAPVVRGLLNDAAFASGSFDVVTMWDVIEHVYDPRAVIAEAARLLRPGGIFVVNQPNTESIDRRLFGRLWVGYELPRHLYLFPPRVLRGLMAEYGLRELERRCLYGSHGVMADNLVYLAEERLGRGAATSRLGRALRGLPARAVAAPYFAAADRLGLGGNVTTIFVRER